MGRLRNILVGMMTVLMLVVGGQVRAAVTELVSVDSAGVQGNNPSWFLDGNSGQAISADGRFVAFPSDASNLVPGDTNGATDIFVHDRVTGETTRVSVSSTGLQGNGRSNYPSISADGRYVAFDSGSNNLVPGDTNVRADVFVHDRVTGETTRVSVSSSGQQGNNVSQHPSISADGRYVAFESDASNLVPNDTNFTTDVFVHDRVTGETTRVSVSSSGQQGNNASQYPSISADGRFVAFLSCASNLVPGGDANRWCDVFVHDRITGETTMVSVSSSGVQSNYFNMTPRISADGRYVAFDSAADNLVPNDTNFTTDVFVHDRVTGETTIVSPPSGGMSPSISADGRFVAFESAPPSGWPDNIFVHDRMTGETTIVSVSSSGVYGDNSSFSPSISADGRFVAFDSPATNLVPVDTNGIINDVFVHDRGGQLSILKSGSGNGIVLSWPAGIDCGSECEAFFSTSLAVSLSATPDSGGSIFIGFSGDTDCAAGVLTMSQDISCSATFAFCGGSPARIGETPYDSIGQAYAGASLSAAETIEVIASNQQETVDFGEGKTVTLIGGHDCLFALLPNSTTTITGSLTVSSGEITLDRITIR